MQADTPPEAVCRVLALDGGGAKGFYTLGVLKEIEGLVKKPLHECFDLVFGTSTGAIIAALIALGRSVDEIHELYRKHVPAVMRERNRTGRSCALKTLASTVFGDATFTDIRTGIGIVATRWLQERPLVFKADVRQAHGRAGTFVPGFGVKIADAVRASCSAYPFFERTTVTTSDGDNIELIDGGYCANNPTLYALVDALGPLKFARDRVQVVSVGVGSYPEPKRNFWERVKKRHLPVQLLQKTLEINTQSMDQLRVLLFRDIHTVRISDTYLQPEMATDLLEHDLNKLNQLQQRGRESFAAHEQTLRSMLL
jgi:patatin-like phospholipase/acyl hydrolase